MKSFLFLIFIIGFVSQPIIKAQETKENQSIIKFDPARDPAKDLKGAIKEAKKSNKRILLDVGGEWCIWCHRVDSFFVANKDVNDFLHDNYIIVKINYSKENKNEKFNKLAKSLNKIPYNNRTLGKFFLTALMDQPSLLIDVAKVFIV